MPLLLICSCVKRHTPPAIVIETHHILPLSWGGQDVPVNKMPLCAQTHYTVHFILNEFVRQRAQVPRRPAWPRYAYSLAVRAWGERIADHPTPYWLPEPFQGRGTDSTTTQMEG